MHIIVHFSLVLELVSLSLFWSITTFLYCSGQKPILIVLQWIQQNYSISHLYILLFLYNSWEPQSYGWNCVHFSYRCNLKKHIKHLHFWWSFVLQSSAKKDILYECVFLLMSFYSNTVDICGALTLVQTKKDVQGCGKVRIFCNICLSPVCERDLGLCVSLHAQPNPYG